jgi:PKD repeat protein
VQAVHRFPRAGSFTVSLTVTNDRGSTDRATAFVTVGAGVRPTALFSFSPSNPEVLQSVFFNAAASTAAAGRTIVAYDWTFGDGGTDEGERVSHRFMVAGTYNVTLTVTDSSGMKRSIVQVVAIR